MIIENRLDINDDWHSFHQSAANKLMIVGLSVRNYNIDSDLYCLLLR